MIVSKNFFQHKFKAPDNIESRSTSSLLETGVFCFYMERGVPFYLPVGKNILDKIQQTLSEESARESVPVIEIPLVYRNDVLQKGEPLGGIFESKIFYLDGELEGRHMLTTPEPFMIELATAALESHNQLPLAYTYHVDVFRALQRPEGILKGIQFKTFMGHSMDENQESVQSSSARFENITDRVFSKLGIKTHKIRKSKGVNLEYFYTCSEGDNLDLPEISNERVSALSLAMVYQYCPDMKLWARFRNGENKNSRILYNTYGLGTQRVFYALLDSSRDDKGFNLPVQFAPYELSVVPARESDLEIAGREYEELTRLGIRAMFDDRRKVNLGDKLKFSDFIGVPDKLIISDEGYTLKSRNNGVKVSKASLTEALEAVKK